MVSKIGNAVFLRNFGKYKQTEWQSTKIQCLKTARNGVKTR
mgnify:CR=1 FL=1